MHNLSMNGWIFVVFNQQLKLALKETFDAFVMSQKILKQLVLKRQRKMKAIVMMMMNMVLIQSYIPTSPRLHKRRANVGNLMVGIINHFICGWKYYIYIEILQFILTSFSMPCQWFFCISFKTFSFSVVFVSL